MKQYARQASVLWVGTRQRGKGAIRTPRSGLKMALYAAGGDIRQRGTNPPELIAAAHAGSFSLTLANELGEAGYSLEPVKRHSGFVGILFERFPLQVTKLLLDPMQRRNQHRRVRGHW